MYFANLVNLKLHQDIAYGLLLMLTFMIVIHEISRKYGNIEYSFNVPKSVCELTKRIGAIEIMVADVQQQNGTNDCGVFAAAFAACLCLNIDPCTLTFDQVVMRKALMKCLDSNDITTFIPDVAMTDKRSFTQEPLQSNRMDLYCRCRLPDNGTMRNMQTLVS